LSGSLQGTGRKIRQGFEVRKRCVGGLLRHRAFATAQQRDRKHTGLIRIGGRHRAGPPFACLVDHCDELARHGDRLRSCGLRLRGKLCRHCLRRVCRFQDFRRETLFGTLRREAAFELCKRVALALNQLIQGLQLLPFVANVSHNRVVRVFCPNRCAVLFEIVGLVWHDYSLGP
jgi:hypothetical protein